MNLLLFCCWAGAQGRRLAAADLDRLLAAVGGWQAEVVGPLRAVRRRLKEVSGAAAGAVGGLRQAVKDCELEAERIEQDLLHAALAGPSRPCDPASAGATDPAACAAANLAAYVAASGHALGTADEADLEALLRGAFEGLAPRVAQGLLRR